MHQHWDLDEMKDTEGDNGRDDGEAPEGPTKNSSEPGRYAGLCLLSKD